MQNTVKDFLKQGYQKGFFHILLANVLTQFIGFITQIYIAWFLLPEDLGRIKILLTFMTLGNIVGGLCLNVSALKLCSENRSPDEEAALFRKGWFYTLISSITIYLILIAANALKWTSSDVEIRHWLPWALIPVITYTLTFYIFSWFKAKKSFQTVSKIMIFNKLSVFIGIIFLTSFFSIKGYWMAQNIGFLLTLILTGVIFLKHTKGLYFKTKIKHPFKTHWNIAKFSFGINIADQLVIAGDILLLNFLVKDMEQIGYYSIAVIFVLLLQLIPNAAQQITAPYFSEKAHCVKNFIVTYQKYQRLFVKLIWLSFGVVVIGVPLFVHWFFKEKYDPSFIYFIFLALGWCFRSMTYLKGTALFGLGKIHREMKSSWISNALGFTLSFGLIYKFGVMGAAWGALCSGIVVYIILSVIFKNTLKSISERDRKI